MKKNIPENELSALLGTGMINDISGNYQSNIFSSILGNFEQYDKMLGDYDNSAGSAMKEAMKSADTFEGSLNRLSNTWTDTVENVMGSKELTTAVNGLNELLGVANSITSEIGGLGTAAVIGGGILGANGLGLTVSYSS